MSDNIQPPYVEAAKEAERRCECCATTGVDMQFYEFVGWGRVQLCDECAEMRYRGGVLRPTMTPA